MFASAIDGYAPVSLSRRNRATRRQAHGPRAHRFDAPGLECLARLSGHTMQVLAGNYLVRQGYPFYDLYAVRSGRIQASVRDAEGRVDVLRDFLPGEIIGLAARAAGRYGADFVALESSTVCPIPLHILDSMFAVDRRKLV